MLRRFLKERNLTFEAMWSEVWNLFKFGIVGVTSLALNASVYALFSRVVWESGNRTLQSVLAVSISAIYNFTLHQRWTFRARSFNAAMVSRYIIVIMIGAGLQGALFYVGHELLHLFDFAVLIGSAFLVAGATYFLHRWFTFHPKHEEKANTGISSSGEVSY